MEKIYVIKQHYLDIEGYDHFRLFKRIFFESYADAYKVVEKETLIAMEEEYEELDLYVDELTKAMED